MPETSAGLLLYRRTALAAPGIEVFLGHMGGPFWARKDDAAWSLPKGLFTTEEPLDAARREFEEEIGVVAPDVPWLALGEFRQPSGKRLTVFSGEVAGKMAELSFVGSNTFEVEWPPRSGRLQSFAEIDRAEWFSLDDARTKVVRGQLPILDALQLALA